MVTKNTLELFYSIIANCPTSVKAFLEKDDTDPNGVLHLTDLNPDSFRDKLILCHFDDAQSASVTPLLVSLLSSILSYTNDGVLKRDTKTWHDRIETIILHLLQRGANVCQDCSIQSFTGLDKQGHHHLESIRPYELVQCLQEHFTSSHFAQYMKRVVHLFQEHAEWPEKFVPVRASTANTWKSLLFSESTSDVHFCCNDGTVLYAHKCILSASTPFFERYFQGPWGAHFSNTWNTENSPDLMRVVLTFLYTGEIDKTVLESDPVGLFVVACEYEIDALRHLAERTCMNDICMENITTMLIVSHLHASKPLQRSCARFVQEKPSALEHPSIVSISSQHPELWEDIQAALGFQKQEEDEDEEE